MAAAPALARQKTSASSWRVLNDRSGGYAICPAKASVVAARMASKISKAARKMAMTVEIISADQPN